MREGWRRIALADIADFRNGLNFLRGDKGHDIKVVGVGDFQRHEALIDFSATTIVTVAKPVANDDLLRDNDLLFVRSNGNKALVGRCVLISGVTEPVTFSGFTIRARIRSSIIDPSYLSKLVRSPLFLAHLHREGGGSSINNLNQEALSDFTFGLPPLAEQRKIAAILRTWDLGLEKLSALRKAKEQLRLWLRTEVVTGRRRLPGFSGVWREAPLSDVLTEHGEASTGAEEVYSVSVHKGLVNQIEHLGRSFAAASTDHYNRVLPGDIVYTKSPTGDFPLGIIKQSHVDHAVIVSPLYGVFTPLRRELGIMLEAHFEAPLAVSNYLNPLVQKGAKNTIAITNKRFLEGKLRLPLDPNEQKAIAAILETSRRELDAIDREIAALTRQKRGLMQKLLTGEWAVNLEGAKA